MLWVRLGKLQDNDAKVLAHESLCKILEPAMCYDQVDVASLACMELLVRQVQVLEEGYKDKFSSNTDVSFDIALMSGTAARSQLCIAPSLSSWVADEARKEVAILKERRKAREEKALLKK